MSTLVASAAVPVGTPTPARRRRFGFLRALLSNRKAVVGLVIFLVFAVMAIAAVRPAG